MKKIILSATAMLVFGFTNAQETKAKSPHTSTETIGGLKAGLNFANVSNSDGGSALLSFHAGAFAEFKISSKFSIQPEVLYSAQGTQDDGLKFHLNYINIPVMAKFYVTDKIALEAGPQVGFLVKAEITDGDNSADIKDLFNTTDFGLNLGAAFELNDQLGIGVRYNFGLSDLIKEVEPGLENSQNRVIQISLAYKL